DDTERLHHTTDLIAEMSRDRQQLIAGAHQCADEHGVERFYPDCFIEACLCQLRQTVGIIGVGLIERLVQYLLRMARFNADRGHSGPVSNTTRLACGACLRTISARSCGSDTHLPRQIRLPSWRMEIAVSFNETSKPIYCPMVALRSMREPGSNR